MHKARGKRPRRPEKRGGEFTAERGQTHIASAASVATSPAREQTKQAKISIHSR